MTTAQPSLPDELNGCKVFPCRESSKLPATAHGWKDASADPVQIADWHKINPKFNWAVACGLSNLFVIDVDPAGLEWWADILRFRPEVAHAVKRALTVRTPRGGLHVYFTGEGPSTASRIAGGIDTRGTGGYVLLPGSRTDAGTYDLIGGSLFPLPDCIRDMIPARKSGKVKGLDRDPAKDQPRNVAWAIELLKGYVKDGRVSVEGSGGNATAFAVAASILDKAISPALTLELLLEHWNPHCSPEWEEWELEIVVRNAAEYGEETKGGSKGLQSNSDAFAAFATEYVEPEKPAIQRKDRVQWIEDYADTVSDPEWLIPGILPARGTGMIYGQSGSYKSFIALDMALCLAHGVPGQWGAAPVPNDVLYLAGEGPIGAARKRRPAWQEWQGVEGKSRLAFYPRVPFYSDRERWEEVKQDVEAIDVKPRLIIIDTLARLMTGMDENNTKDATMATSFMEELAHHYECFVMAVHHTGKDESKGARGSSAFQANVDMMLYTKLRYGGTSMAVKKQKDADVPDKPILFELKEVGQSIVLARTDSLPEAPRAGKSKIEWASPEAIAEILKGGSMTTNLLVREIADRNNLDPETVKKQLSNRKDIKHLCVGGNWRFQEYDL